MEAVAGLLVAVAMGVAVSKVVLVGCLWALFFVVTGESVCIEGSGMCPRHTTKKRGSLLEEWILEDEEGKRPGLGYKCCSRVIVLRSIPVLFNGSVSSPSWYVW